MTNTLILNVSCVYFLSSCSLLCVSSYGLGTYIGHPTAQRSHVDCYTPEKCQHHLIPLTTVFLLLELLGELLIACLWGDLSHHHCLRFTKFKKKKKKKNLCSKTITSDLIDFLP